MRAQTELCYYNAGLKTKQICYKGLCPSSEQPESVQHHELNNSLLVETAQPTLGRIHLGSSKSTLTSATTDLTGKRFKAL